jgi:hypothetical protein
MTKKCTAHVYRWLSVTLALNDNQDIAMSKIRLFLAADAI